MRETLNFRNFRTKEYPKSGKKKDLKLKSFQKIPERLT